MFVYWKCQKGFQFSIFPSAAEKRLIEIVHGNIFCSWLQIAIPSIQWKHLSSSSSLNLHSLKFFSSRQRSLAESSASTNYKSHFIKFYVTHLSKSLIKDFAFNRNIISKSQQNCFFMRILMSRQKSLLRETKAMEKSSKHKCRDEGNNKTFSMCSLREFHALENWENWARMFGEGKLSWITKACWMNFQFASSCVTKQLVSELSIGLWCFWQ